MEKEEIDKNIEKLDKNIENLNKKIELQMKKAFYNLIIEKTSSTNPDFDWLVSLYTEIKQGLIKILKKNSTLYKEIDENLDVELFSQMIKNNAFSGKDMIGLVNYTYEKLLQLGSPARDKVYNNRKNEIIEYSMKADASFGGIVGLYLKNTHMSIDELHEDIANIKSNLEKINKK